MNNGVRAQNETYRGALALKGFLPLGGGRMRHPGLGLRAQRRLAHKVWVELGERLGRRADWLPCRCCYRVVPKF